MSGTSPTPERWRRIEEIIDAVLDSPPWTRDTELDRRCDGDAALRADVERILARGEETTGFLDVPVDTPSAVGKYEIVGPLGRGGMGVVYLARDPALDRPVALKLLPPGLDLETRAQRRFVDEARATSSLDHPNVATIYEIGQTDDGRLFIAMAYYDGETLKARLARGSVPIDEVEAILERILTGLGAVHGLGIVHRDVKPANVLLTDDGGVKLVDFGIAKAAGEAATRTGAAIGTVAYMSPEQTRGEPVDARADLWAVGVVAYEMLTGRRPFRGDSDAAVVHGIREDEPAPIRALRDDVPSGLEALVRDCLAKDAADRPADADAAVALLRDGRPAPASNRAVHPRRRRSVVATALAGAAILAAWWLRPSPRAPTPTGDAAASATMSDGASLLAMDRIRAPAGDSALARLGRELTITVGTALDGLGSLRTAPLPIGETEPGDLDATLASARRVGADRLLRGTLIGVGPASDPQVRIDVELLDPRAGTVVSRASAAGVTADLVALTDSATLAIVRAAWDDEPPATKSLSEITTRSLPALRAFLEGEAAFERGAYDEAVEAYERAVGADSTFWFAHWRALYPRRLVGAPRDSTSLAAVLDHRSELPERERLLVEAVVAEGVGDRLAALRRLTQRHPGYWSGWWELGEELMHRGPFAGADQRETLAALRRAVALNPRFAPAWEHLFWTSVFLRDTASANEARDRLRAFAAPDAPRINADMMPYVLALDGVLNGQGRFAPGAAEGIAGTAVRLHEAGAPMRPEALAVGFVAFGFPRAQVEFADAMRAAGARGELSVAQNLGRALALATLGDWRGALASADTWAAASADPAAGLRRYGLAVVAASLGEVPPGEAATRRPDPADAVSSDGSAEAELAWLDGVLAFARTDAPGLAGARERLARSAGPASDRLARSLVAFERALAGDSAAAATELAAIEADASGLASRYRAPVRFPAHPHESAIHRMVASRWSLAAGDTATAEDLLTWHEAIGPMHRAELVNRTVEPYALLQRARLEEAAGRSERARSLYHAVIDRRSEGPSASGALLEEALGALRRVSP